MDYVIGIDEVGRGALAGPVAVGAVLVPAHLRWQDFEKLKDSKKLSPQKRELWLARMYDEFKFTVAVSFSGARSVDTLGIVGAVNNAATRAVHRVLRKLPEGGTCQLMCDAGIRVRTDLTPRLSEVHQSQVVRGDENVPAIAFASIAAKVKRDDFMCRLSEKHPIYGFAQHKGYGTVEHQKIIRKNGIVESVHRVSFTRGILTHS